MKKFHIFALTAIILCFSVCVGGCSEKKNGNIEQNDDENHVIYDSLADFLSEEQIDLYNKALKIYPLFRGHPDSIDTLHLILNNASYDERRSFSAELSSQRIQNNDVISGYQYSHKINRLNYLLSMGEYQSLSSLKDLCLSVFTNEYWCRLNRGGSRFEYDRTPQFLEIDGRLYYNSVSMGGPFGYNPSEYPDKYELTSVSDTEIDFNVIAHYKSSNVDPDYTVTTKSFPVKLVLTDIGWRFSLFNTASS